MKKLLLFIFTFWAGVYTHAAVLKDEGIIYNHSLCPGGSVVIDGKFFNQVGVHMDTISTEDYRFHVINWAWRYRTDSCTSTPGVWEGKYIFQPGDYRVDDPGHGCKSQLRLLFCSRTIRLGYDTVYVNQIEQYPYICRYSYEYGNDTLWSSGTYYEYAGITMDGTCDSVVQLHLTIHPYEYRIVSVEKPCYNDTLILNGDSVTTTGVYYDRTNYYTDKDIILYRALIFRNHKDTTERARLPYDGSGYTWPRTGQTYYEPGIQEYAVYDGGCEIEKYYLVLDPAKRDTTKVTICENDSYTWQGQTFNTAGSYFSADGTKVLILSVKAIDDQNRYCCGNKYEAKYTDVTGVERTVSLTADGYYIDYKKDASKCYSATRYHVIFRKKTSRTDKVIVVGQNSYTWYQDGKTYDKTQKVTITNKYTDCTCVKDEYILELYIYPDTVINTPATICEGKEYEWHYKIDNYNTTKKISTAGSYSETYTITSYDGVKHTIVSNLDLTVLPKVGVLVDTNLCYIGETKPTFHIPGTTKDVEVQDTVRYTYKQASCGCDSVVTYAISLNQPDTVREYDTICHGSSLWWKGRQYVETGQYYDYHYDTTGTCVDVITQLNLIVHPHERVDTTIIWNKRLFGDYVLDNVRYTHDTIIRIENVHHIYKLDCDCEQSRIITLHMPPSSTVDTMIQCKGHPYIFHGREYTKDTTDYFLVDGEDSIYNFHVKFTDAFVMYDTVYVRSIRPYYSIGMARDSIPHTQSGDFVDTLKSRNGCDSLVYLHLEYTNLRQHPELVPDSTIIKCEGDYAIVGGKKYTTPISNLLVTEVPCSYSNRPNVYDSVVCYNVYFRQPFFKDTVGYVCPGEATLFHQNGQPRWVWLPEGVSEGLFYDSCKSSVGCDSIIRFRLIKGKTFFNVDSVYRYSFQKPYRWERGGEFYDNVVAYDSLKTVNGACDSVYKLVLQFIGEEFIQRIDTSFCAGDSIQIPGRHIVFKEAGYYRDSVFVSQLGIYRYIDYYITMKNTYYSETKMAMCPGGSVWWRGKYYTREGYYADTLKTVSCHCDSIVALQLIENPAKRKEVDTIAIARKGQSFEYAGFKFKRDTVFYDTLRTIHGCDSILKIKLHFTSHVSYDSLPICPGDSLIFGKDTIRNITENLTRQYVYVDLDSIQVVTFVPQKSSVKTRDAWPLTFCADADSFYIRHQYNQNFPRPTFFTVEFDSVARKYGCRNDTYNYPDSATYPGADNILAVPVNTDGNMPVGLYEVKLTVKEAITTNYTTVYCAEKQPTVMKFYVNYASSVLYQLWNNVVAVQVPDLYVSVEDAYNIRWYQNDKLLEADGSYLYGNPDVYVGARIHVELQEKGDSMWIASCPIVVTDYMQGVDPEDAVPHIDNSVHYISMNRTTCTRDNTLMSIYSNHSGTYRLYSATGLLLQEDAFLKNEYPLTLPAMSGIYLLHLQTDDGYVKIFKLRVE